MIGLDKSKIPLKQFESTHERGHGKTGKSEKSYENDSGVIRI